MGTLCRPVYKDYWFGVADNWGKAELDGDNLYCQKYGVSCLFFFGEPSDASCTAFIFYFIFFVTFLEWMDRP